MRKKNYRCAEALVVLLLVVFLLAGCKAAVMPEEDDKSGCGNLPASENESPVATGPREVAWTGLELDSEIREQLTGLIECAELLGQGVRGESCLSYDKEKPHMANGKLYYPITDARLPSFAEFMVYLHRTYVPELVDLLLQKGEYIEVDGLLYVNVEDAPDKMTERKEAIEAEVTRITNSTVVVKLQEHYRSLNGELATYSSWTEFVFSKGAWLFAPYGYEFFVWSGIEISPMQEARFEELVRQHDIINDSMFQLDSLKHDYNATARVNDRDYYLVTDTRFPNYESLKAFLRQTYTEEFTAWYLRGDNYVEVEGRLYTTGGAAGWPPEDLIEATVMRVLEASETMVIVEKEQTKEYEDGRVYQGLHMYKFVQEDGKWLLAPYYDL